MSAYDPQWPARFELERAALEQAIGVQATGGIHHIGSTAIPGVAAEPVIDILVGTADHTASQSCVGELGELSYRSGPQEDGEVHSLFKTEQDERLYNLHLVPMASARYAEMLAFRDFLRTDTQAAIGYAAMKRDLADRHGGDRRLYNADKVELIQTVLACLV